MTVQAWDLMHLARPVPANEYERMHHLDRASYAREWREAFGWLARQSRVPRLKRVTIAVAQTCTQAPLPNIAGTTPATQAALDGLVDAGVIVDAGPTNVVAITFLAPEFSDRDRFVLSIEEFTEIDTRPSLRLVGGNLG